MTERKTPANQFCRDERGAALSNWAALLVVAFALIAGIAVDLSGLVYAQSAANNTASQAARVAGEQIDKATMSGGKNLAVTVAEAKRAALKQVTAQGMAGNVTVAGQTMTVTVTNTWQPVFLSMIGVHDLTATGQASARIVTAVSGTERK